jgi:uncharacterized protein (DUF433 family)
MNKQYIEKVGGGYRLTGSRVSLDSIVYSFLRGETAESIAQSFPVLTLEQVYGAITYYLANQSEVDRYLKKANTEFGQLRRAIRAKDPMFYKKLAEKRQSVA